MVLAVEKDGNEPPFLSDSLADTAHSEVLPPILPLHTNMCGVWNLAQMPGLSFTKIFQSTLLCDCWQPAHVGYAPQVDWLQHHYWRMMEYVWSLNCELVCCFRRVPKAKAMQWEHYPSQQAQSLWLPCSRHTPGLGILALQRVLRKSGSWSS